MAKRTHAEEVVEREYLRCVGEFGNGWTHLSPTIRKAMVYSRLLTVTLGMKVSGNVSAQDILDWQVELVRTADDMLDARGWR